MPRRNPSSFEDEGRDSPGFTGLHFDNLFDEDWDTSGERYDLATGEPYNNSGEIGRVGMRLADSIDELELPPSPEDDMIDKWLERLERSDVSLEANGDSEVA